MASAGERGSKASSYHVIRFTDSIDMLMREKHDVTWLVDILNIHQRRVLNRSRNAAVRTKSKF